MKKIVNVLEQMPKWYGFCIILLYSLLIAEFLSTVNKLVPMGDLLDNNFFVTLSRITYAITILSGIVVWVVSTFLFHLTALLFNGQAQFKRFLFVSSYPYIIPAIMILVSIFLLDGIHIPNTEDTLNILINNQSFKLAVNLINYSFIPYYLMIAVLIHYIHQIKYIYAFLSVAIPVVSIWLITELFKLI